MGEGSANLTDPHHPPTIIQPLTQPQKTQKPRKPKKDTQVPQSSDPTKNVIDEAVHKELGDSLVRAATTASILEAEQDNGNINKTQSKATPNESSYLGTTSGGGPKGNTFQSVEDRLKLDELMALCTTLQNRVLDLEKTKTTQHNEIASLKRRVKVESSNNEESLGEDASKQGRIDAIDADEENTLVSVQNMDEEMFDVNVLDGEEVFIAEREVVVKDVNNVVSTAGDATTEKGKGILIEPVKPMNKKDLIRLDEEAALKLQVEFDEEERLAREKAKKEKEANIALIETWDDI
ncbi:hypothetical protein Tco_1425538 [Tanacetum coccineum]